MRPLLFSEWKITEWFEKHHAKRAAHHHLRLTSPSGNDIRIAESPNGYVIRIWINKTEVTPPRKR